MSPTTPVIIRFFQDRSYQAEYRRSIWKDTNYFVLRLISLLRRSSGLVEWILRQ